MEGNGLIINFRQARDQPDVGRKKRGVSRGWESLMCDDADQHIGDPSYAMLQQATTSGARSCERPSQVHGQGCPCSPVRLRSKRRRGFHLRHRAELMHARLFGTGAVIWLFKQMGRCSSCRQESIERLQGCIQSTEAAVMVVDCSTSTIEIILYPGVGRTSRHLRAPRASKWTAVGELMPSDEACIISSYDAVGRTSPPITMRAMLHKSCPRSLLEA